MREFLLKHADIEPVSFHMPGHKGSAVFRKYGYGEFLDRLADCDITEIPGADNLFQAEGALWCRTVIPTDKRNKWRNNSLNTGSSEAGR